MSLVALASRQTEAAVKMAAAAVAVAPGMGAAWVALGQALKADRRGDEAERAYERAIALDGMNALARLGLGELRIAAGRAEEAAGEFELALAATAGAGGGAPGSGQCAGAGGRNEEALGRYEQALALRPRLPEAEYAAGFALARLGQDAGGGDPLPAGADCAAGFCRCVGEPGVPAAGTGARGLRGGCAEARGGVAAGLDCGLDQPGDA